MSTDLIILPKGSNNIEQTADTPNQSQILHHFQDKPANNVTKDQKEKKTITHVVSPDTRLDKIFTNGLPVNAFIDKGRCAIGATTIEIEDISRCTLISAPTIPILLGKKAAHPELDIVHGDISFDEVVGYFNNYKPGQKIMTTPEGMEKVMNAAFIAGRYDEVISEWFLLLDECHTFATEDFREGILCPFDYFWDFSYKSIISATPYYFSDPRFNALTYYKIIFDAPLGIVTLVNAVSPQATLNWILRHPDDYPGHLHIMLNSVTEIGKAIVRANLQDCNIFCANDKDKKNMRKLGDLERFYKEQPQKGEYKKFNFYTCKYFEGWDLYDENATMLLVTNVHVPHTKVGVKSKGKQAIGRLRDEPYKYIHITNHNNIHKFKSIETISAEFLADAEFLIKQNNEYALECRKMKREYREDARLKYFADRNKYTNIATLNRMLLDQQTNEAANNEIYNHIDYIEQDWKDGYFETEIEPSNLKLETTTTMKRKSTAKQLEEDYLLLINHHEDQQANKIFTIEQSLEESIKVSNPTAYDASKYLDKATMIALKYNVKKVQTEIILRENNLKQVKLLRLIWHEFKTGAFYSNEEIKTKLQAIYNKLSIRDKTGSAKVATASQIRSKGLFEVADTKRPDGKGNEVHGKLIIRAQFNLRMAA